MTRALNLLLALLIATPVAAADAQRLSLDGELRQGAVVIGQTRPGATVRFDGRQVRVGPNGHFVIGLDRDAPETQPLEIRFGDDDTLRRELSIARRDYNIQRIDGLAPKQVNPPEEVIPRILREVRMVKEARKRDDAREDFLQDFQWPVQGRITGVYGSQRILNGEPKRPHYGWDIAAPAGTPVLAPAAGIVTVAEPDMYYSGGTLLLDHGHGLSSAFLHMQSLSVEVGQRVERGDKIGEVGSTGRSTGAHLDWRMNWFDRRVDPRTLAGPMSKEVAGGN